MQNDNQKNVLLDLIKNQIKIKPKIQCDLIS